MVCGLLGMSFRPQIKQAYHLQQTQVLYFGQLFETRRLHAPSKQSELSDLSQLRHAKMSKACRIIY
jgi:hypothetical protein